MKPTTASEKEQIRKSGNSTRDNVLLQNKANFA
jgi:hypothetical protein